ncbi:hypothetical protein THAOC_22223 [Thalassiosira oceanica]|uniref:Uncharacterized protein n=1 Tax=Thalassiosira oceanica TaxID=159749 RepID=K0RZ51_THAOC|nr:hypothetical protein THAOC_22223 [Thalassiosira oceanica]|eukprot:EJK57699.1 hypothetical protein THAOC_22223 [Thalassiosira oceanica]
MADLALYDRHVRGGRGPGRGSGALAVKGLVELTLLSDLEMSFFRRGSRTLVVEKGWEGSGQDPALHLFRQRNNLSFGRERKVFALQPFLLTPANPATTTQQQQQQERINAGPEERNRGFRSPERKKEREGRFRQLSNHTKLSTGLLGPRGWAPSRGNTPSAGGSRIRKELKPADGAGEYIEEAAFVGDIVESVRTRRHRSTCLAEHCSDCDICDRLEPRSPLTSRPRRGYGRAKAVLARLEPRSSIVDQSASTAAGRLNLIEYPVQAGRQQPLPHPGEGGGLTRRARPLSTVSLASPSPHAADGSQRLFR